MDRRSHELEKKSKEDVEFPSIMMNIQTEKPEEIARGSWGNQVEFLLTCVGYAVGLGSVWRFPYLCFKNGGGAFLLPYLIMLLLVGLPIFFFELSLGQFASLGPISVWNAVPLFRGIGYSMGIFNLMLGLYYNVLIAWSFYFLISSMTSTLPWSICDGAWNTPACIMGDELKMAAGNQTALNHSLSIRNLTSRDQLKSPSEEFFYNNVLQISSDIGETGTVIWQLALCLMICWLIVFLTLIKGISSLGKVVYFVAIFPYIMMTVMLVRGVTLEGASNGILYYLKPELSRLLDAGVWSDAATQIFYSLSTCTGGLIVMSSYNPFKNNVLRDSILVPVITFFTCLLAGFVIFAVLGFMAHNKGVDVADVAASGPGLVFVVYPEALAQLPLPQVWAVLFFIMLITLGFSSQFSIVEAIFTSFLDEFSWILRKNKYRPFFFRSVCICVFFVMSLPMVTNSGFYILTLLDDFLSGFPLLAIGALELAAIQWVYGPKHFAEDVKMMLGRRPCLAIRICWVGVTPIALLVVMISKGVQYKDLTINGEQFPGWALILGWLTVAFILAWVPLLAIITWLRTGGWNFLDGIKQSVKPLPTWGPALDENRTGKYYPLSSPSYNESCLKSMVQLSDEMPGAMKMKEQVNRGFEDEEGQTSECHQRF